MAVLYGISLDELLDVDIDADINARKIQEIIDNTSEETEEKTALVLGVSIWAVFNKFSLRCLLFADGYMVYY